VKLILPRCAPTTGLKICSCFIVGALVAVFLTGCGSGSSPSKNEIENAITQYVGLARPDIGDVKVDECKILKDYAQKVGDEDVFFRQFKANYTVTFKNNPSKHSFEGTVALYKQGQKWEMRRDLCILTYAYSPPMVEVVPEGTNLNDPRLSEESKRKIREQTKQTNE
jgi:hypothetical protein